MFFNLFKKSKNEEVEKLVQMCLWNASASKGQAGNPDGKDWVELAKYITPTWMDSLPSIAVDGCSPRVLAAYVLIAESQVYAKESSSLSLAQNYVNAAKMAVQGIGFRDLANQVTDSEFKMLIIMAKLAQAAGLNFYSELLEI